MNRHRLEDRPLEELTNEQLAEVRKTVRARVRRERRSMHKETIRKKMKGIAGT